MLLSFIAMIVVGGAFGLEHLGVLIASIGTFSRGGGMEAGGAMRILALIGNILMLLGFLALIAGQVFWIFITNKQGGLTWAIVCLSVGGFSLIFFLVFRFLPVVSATQFPYGIFIYFRASGPFERGGIGLENAILPTFAMILIAAHMMMIGFYLQTLGKTLKDRMISNKGMQIVITAGVARPIS